jgi:hypothetical protein
MVQFERCQCCILLAWGRRGQRTRGPGDLVALSWFPPEPEFPAPQILVN